MTRHGAFLRAINLGPTRRISSAELRDCFEGLGFDDVATFRSSGNVVFASDGRPSRDRIEEALREATGHEVPVFLRDEDELRAIAAAEPFPPAEVEASTGKLQVMLLERKPAEAALELATADDRLALGARELYWLPALGVGRSELDSKALEQLVGPTTVRTMGTMEQMVRKFL